MVRKNRPLSREEREIIISKTGADTLFEVFVSDSTFHRRLLKAGWTPFQADLYCWWFALPPRAITIRSKRSVDGPGHKGCPSSLHKARAAKPSPQRHGDAA